MDEDELDSIGAGDQGIHVWLCFQRDRRIHAISQSTWHTNFPRQLTEVRKDGTLKYLRPDGKTQVTVEYDENGKPSRIDAVVLLHSA